MCVCVGDESGYFWDVIGLTMIFERSILREKITLTAVLFFTLFTIITVFFLVRALGDVNEGAIALDVLLKYLLVMSLQYFPLIMVATVVIAITSTVARLYKDSEMVVWQSSGVGTWALFKPVWMLVLPMVLFLVFMSVVLVPWANQKLAVYQKNSVASQLNLIKDGSFQTTKDGARTVFVQTVKTGTLPAFERIFITQNRPDKRLVVTADSAYAKISDDARLFLILENGRQYFLDANKQQISSMRFGQYGISMSDVANVEARKFKETPVDQLPILTLFKTKTSEARAEFYRRISDAWMIVPMAIFAVVLGYARPRSNKTWGILMGVALLMIYLNFIKMGESAIARGQLRAWWAFAMVHGGFLLLSLLALWYRNHAWRFSNLSLSALWPFKRV